MRGLAFPTTAVYEREDSYDHGTPFSGVDDIPIDPALSTSLDPALLGEGGSRGNGQGPTPLSYIPYPNIQHKRQWSPGPQGDPFAPQPMPSYMSIEEPSRPNPKPPKKKRKFIRETECGFCQGGDTKNNVGVAEQLLTCSECGRSGHPTCLGLEELDDVVRSYAWKCVECKNCEVCQEKGGDTRMLFCDVCDRGWHMECLQPPLTEEPPGKWNCPMCPSPEYLLQDVPPEFYPGQTLEPDCAASHPLTSPLRHRETSVASSSRSAARAFSKQKRKGKARATTDESEVEVDIDLTVENGAVSSTSKRPPKGKSRWKGKTPMKDRPSVIEEVPEPDPDPDVTRPAKRMRLRLASPVPPSKTPVPSTPKITPIIRLKLGPPKDKGKFREEETEEPKKGIFDDVLSLEDRDTTQTTMKENDKLRFERSRAAAEAKLYPPPTSAIPPEAEEDPIPGPSSRPLRSHHSVLPSAPTPGPSASPAPSTPVTTFNTSEKLLRIRSIRFGEYEIQTWYDAPFPEEYATIPDGQLWICEFCLKYMKSRFVASRHQLKCKMRHPPGDEIYRDGAISIYEVDGRKNKIYCQNLCLLSKMFLDHKSLFYDVEPFLFYVMTEVDDIGSRFVGYFSKEKRSPKDYNVSCIMTLPVRQRQGWGNLLIDFSYLLSKKEQRPGSPEKPLSALGALGYRNYWTLALMRYLHTAPPDPRLEDISTATSLTIEDICTTLSQQRMIAIQDATPPPKPLPGQTIKFPKGRKNGIARKHLQRTITQDDEKVKGPFVLPRSYKIHWNPEVVEHYLARWEAKGYLKLKLEGLKWSPFLIARTKKSDVLDPDVIVEGSEVDAYAQNGGGHTNAVSETPGTPGPLKAVKAVDSRTDSPAAALFDDDTVETIIPAHTAATSDPDELPVVQISSSARSNLRRPSQVDTPDLEREPKPSETERTSAPVSPTISPRKRAVPNTPLRRSRRTSSGTGTASHPIEVEREDLTAEKEKERPSLRRRRTRSGLPKVPNGQDMSQSVSVDPSVADDAALAAKLAMEDRPRRQLRSRSNTDQQEPKKPTALPFPPTRSISPRKRKRVGSPSPEPEPDEEPTPTNPRITRRTSMKVNRPQAPLPKAKRGPSPVKSRVKAIPALSTPTPSRPRRTSSRFMTGAPTPNPPLHATSQRRRRIPSSSPVRSPSIAPGPEQEREQEQEQEREVINVDEDAKVTSPVYSDRIHIHDSPDAMSEGDPNPNLQQEDDYDPLFDDPLEGLESLPEGSIVDAEPQLPFEHGTEEPAEPDPEQDVKLENEDMGTPLTGVTSSYGQSVPSDYTVIAEETVNSGNVIMAKGSPTSPTVTLNGEVPAEEVDVEMVSPEAQKVGSCRRDLADIVPPKPSKVIVEGVVSLLDEDEDADAEGEPDIDADGEVDDGGVDVDLDAEGEVVDDLDAEGEPDDDAEGEPDIDLDGDVAVVVSS